MFHHPVLPSPSAGAAFPLGPRLAPFCREVPEQAAEPVAASGQEWFSPVMEAAPPALTPAEAMLLLDLRRAPAAGLFKVSAMALLLRRVLRAEAEQRRGWVLTRTVTRLRAGQVPALPPHEAAVVRLVQSAGGEPGRPTVEEVVAAAKRVHGPALDGYRRDLVLPALVRRKLAEVRAGGWFGFKRLKPTPAGAAAQAELRALLERGRMVPRWLDSDPRQAAMAAAALGPLVLLVNELKPHLKRLAQAMPRRDAGGGDGGGSGPDGADTGSGRHKDCGSAAPDPSAPGPDAPGSGTPGQGIFDPGAFDFGALDAAGFDAGTFDALDSAMSSFDSATDGGDSGGSDSGSGGE